MKAAKNYYGAMCNTSNNKALIYRAWGPSTELFWQDISIAKPKSNQVLVKVTAVSINPVDWKILAGQQRYVCSFGRRGYRVFGSDFCATIVAIGNKVDQALLGKRICGMVNPLSRGSFCNYLLVAKNQLCFVPDHVSTHKAAALPAAGLTVARAVASQKKLMQKRCRCIVWGAGGGVGHLLVQMLVAQGQQVIAVASESKHAWLYGLGVSTCYDYKNQIPIELVQSILQVQPSQEHMANILFDCQGGTLIDFLACNKKAIRLLVSKGLISYLPISVENKLIAKTLLKSFYFGLLGLRLNLVLAAPSVKLLRQCIEWLANSMVVPCLDSVWKQAQAIEAITYAKSHHAKGKIIVDFGDDDS